MIQPVLLTIERGDYAYTKFFAYESTGYGDGWLE
ncbi:hypothetical protein DesyoDRAFT_3281 [Desulfosporosinus youngiae DSM 17734]|uniref:Uncharacterized protein n=1 Tax=Desulfosporosinus youngiae DSM 17734 TaxID=768710 RepID=H5XWE2_9FIRM|nr:hypothetical protein DesyoDRAFT_3281 [Desulfosporosinus youngiae DSM 17734]